jgi:ribosomal protein S18 acetylase RimI-like enzyme
LKIREIEKNAHDIKGLTSLMNQWDDITSELTYEYIESKLLRILSAENSTVLIAEDNNIILGYVYLCEVIFLGMEPFIELQSILVDSKHRGDGIGKKLIKAAEHWTVAAGFHKIVLSSRTHLTGAHEFYRSLGYNIYKQSYFFTRILVQE